MGRWIAGISFLKKGTLQLVNPGESGKEKEERALIKWRLLFKGGGIVLT